MDIKWKSNIFSIGPFWPTHILERIRAAMNLLEYYRQDFFYGTQWNKVHTDLTSNKWMIGRFGSLWPFFPAETMSTIGLQSSHIFFRMKVDLIISLNLDTLQMAKQIQKFPQIWHNKNFRQKKIIGFHYENWINLSRKITAVYVLREIACQHKNITMITCVYQSWFEGKICVDI